MSLYNDIFVAFNSDDPEPKCDVYSCSECGWEGAVEDCEVEIEGDYESGYYDVPICPICKPEGCINDGSMSKEQFTRWEAWFERNRKRNSDEP